MGSNHLFRIIIVVYLQGVLKVLPEQTEKKNMITIVLII